MCASRLRDFAGPGQVFFSDTVFDAAEGAAVAQPLGGVRINQHGETREAYSLSDLRA
jgi:class 3 adenylate cyclase